MQKTVFILMAILTSCCVLAQQPPVNWQVYSKKLGGKKYELHIKAKIENGWHLYAQHQPKGAISIPTNITFNNNPLILITGKVNEVGELKKEKVKVLDITQYQYENEVDFVQVVTLKANVKTNVSGTVKYEVCNEEGCTFPPGMPFTISLD